MTKMVVIQRLDQKNGSGGWQVVVAGGGGGRTMYFSDSVYGGKAKSRALARRVCKIIDEAQIKAATDAALKAFEHIRRTKP